MLKQGLYYEVLIRCDGEKLKTFARSGLKTIHMGVYHFTDRLAK